MYTQYTCTIFTIKKKITLSYRKFAAVRFFSKELKNKFKTAVVNSLQVFQALKVYWILFVYSALERERSLTLKLRQSLEAEKSQQETTGRERKLIEDLQIQLETERGKVHDLNNALQREHKNIEEVMSSADSEKRLLQEHLDQEREVNHHLKHDLDALQVRV